MKLTKIVFGLTLILLSINIVSCEKWELESNIIIGLDDVGAYSSPCVFQKDSVWYLISGEQSGGFIGWSWTGTEWESNTNIVNGLTDVYEYSSPCIFEINSTWYLISGIGTGLWAGWDWTGTEWESNATIINGLTDAGLFSEPTVFYMDSTYHLITGKNNGWWDGYHWNGTGWESNATIINGLTDVGANSNPSSFQTDSTWYLISGDLTGSWTGFNWNGTGWENDATIIHGLTDMGGVSSPSIFTKNTLLYLISGNTNGTLIGFINTYDNITGIWGSVYEGTTGVDNPLPDVNVYIYNSTWSNTAVTDINGKYEFVNLGNTTYTLNFKKDRYEEVLYQYTTPTTQSMYYKVIYMQKSTGDYYSRHYTTFTLKNIFGARYSNVDTVIYDNGAIEATGTTGTDGSVTFHLFEDAEYTITFVNASQGIDESVTLAPRDSAYTVYVTLLDFSLDDSATVWGKIDYHWSKNRINASHGWVNFTYTDISNSTLGVEYWINRTINNSYNEPTYYFTSAVNGTWVPNSSYTVSQIVLANNTTWVCHFGADNPDLPSLSGSGSAVISFLQGYMIDVGWTELWMYATVSICCIIFIGLLFGQASAATGAVVCVLAGWFFWWIHWLSAAGGVSFVMLCLATVLSILFVMRKGESLKA